MSGVETEASGLAPDSEVPGSEAISDAESGSQEPSKPVLMDDDVELDYEAEEQEEEEDQSVEPVRQEDMAKEKEEKVEERVDEECVKDEEEIEEEVEKEELEEGEVSDEDEETRKERLKPPPVCRFYNKGQCTWGASCRFIHPGVMDTGRYSMFAQPRPILPGAEAVEVEEKAAAAAEEGDTSLEPVPVVPRPETAWERGLRQAKEMRKRSQQRKETDVEYEEKRTNMSLTQAELDKENDYFMRQASPLHDEEFGDEFDDVIAGEYHHIESGRRRVAPPPPVEFSRRGSPRRYPDPDRKFSTSPKRRFPPRPTDEPGRRGDEWADPWMRGGGDRGGGRGGSGGASGVGRRDSPRDGSGSPSRPLRRGRRRSYSSGSSRSSSSSGDGGRTRDHRRRGRRRGRSSSGSSSGSSRSRTRRSSRSSSPDDIPRRGQPHTRTPPRSVQGKNQAPLQKRLGALASSSMVKHIKKEPEDRPVKKSGGNANLEPLGQRKHASSSSRRRRNSSASSRSPSASPPPRKRLGKRERSRTPPRRTAPKLPDNPPGHRASSPSPSKRPPPALPSNSPPPAPASQPAPPPPKQIKMTLKSSNPTKPVNKSVLEKLGDEAAEGSVATNEKSPKKKAESINRSERKSTDKKDKKRDKGDKKTAADRREELLKQLQAVENAIAKKRTKISSH